MKRTCIKVANKNSQAKLFVAPKNVLNSQQCNVHRVKEFLCSQKTKLICMQSTKLAFSSLHFPFLGFSSFTFNLAFTFSAAGKRGEKFSA